MANGHLWAFQYAGLRRLDEIGNEIGNQRQAKHKYRNEKAVTRPDDMDHVYFFPKSVVVVAADRNICRHFPNSSPNKHSPHCAGRGC